MGDLARRACGGLRVTLTQVDSKSALWLGVVHRNRRARSVFVAHLVVLYCIFFFGMVAHSEDLGKPEIPIPKDLVAHSIGRNVSRRNTTLKGAGLELDSPFERKKKNRTKRERRKNRTKILDGERRQ